jgi:hypothetical protein
MSLELKSYIKCYVRIKRHIRLRVSTARIPNVQELELIAKVMSEKKRWLLSLTQLLPLVYQCI